VRDSAVGLKSVQGQQPESRTLGSLLRMMATKAPKAPAIFHHSDTFTYAELWQTSVAVAKGLSALGVRRGDRVAGLISNRPEWLILAFATSMLGAIYAPLNTWYKVTELEFAVSHLGARVLVSMDSFLTNEYAKYLGRLLPELPTSDPGRLKSERFPQLESVVFIGERQAGAFDWSELADLGREVTDKEVAESISSVSGTDVALILYTSGTTAEPKGVMLRHASMVENAYAIGQRRGMTSSDRLWLGTPLFYAFGAANAFPVTFVHGAAIVIQGGFDAGIAIDLIEKTQSTVYYGLGSIPQAILEHPAFSRDRVRSLVKGHAGLSPADRRRTIVEMGIHGATQSYGMTEAYGHSAVGELDDPLEVKLHTAGRPLPGFEFRIVDPESRELVAPGAAGLVLLRGHVMDQYFRNPSETAKSLEGGYLNTGDLGSIDGDGRFHFRGRIKEIIKSSGNNVSALEIENLLTSHPAVYDAHVVGIPDTLDRGVGEVIVAFVDAASKTTEAELRSHIKERAASFKVPHHILFRPSSDLPRLASGKIAKLLLQAEAVKEVQRRESTRRRASSGRES
jgi:fatty-acyl-CoA synthase